MEEYKSKNIDIAVIGAGHAGIEAALSGSRLGCNTYLFTMNLDSIGNLPCNPSIGGTGKGHLVHEIDSLGGEMGKIADKACLQSRMLNKSKGPAVHSLRMQADRRLYQSLMKSVVENETNLSLVQAEIVDLRKISDMNWEVVTRFGAVYTAKCVIICSGTYLCGNIIVGSVQYSGGPDGMFPADFLSQALRKLNIPLMRFKTGTPARLHADSIDYSVLDLQNGDENPYHFSHLNDEFEIKNKMPCYICYTNEKTHEIIRNNIHRSPIYSGKIKGTGPRYCPSIEDKVVRFADKERHQLFIEPMGFNTKEVYLQGFSSSLPEEVQMEMLHTIKGLENALVMRTAYAIEYDCADPLSLDASLEFKKHIGLFGAGQFNGTSGYEEAAAQGLIAGINAARRILGKDKFTLTRSSSYIGTLIDDLVTKGTNEPYRIMTSRSEYRLLLRQDNADERLTEKGYELGLVSEEQYSKFKIKIGNINKELERIEKINFAPSKSLAELMERKNSTPVTSGINYTDLLRRPEITYDDLEELDVNRPNLSKSEKECVEIKIKYDGYIKRQIRESERFLKLENQKIPAEIDYFSITGIRLETKQKLDKFRPESIGQASRISGVSPADISVLMIYLHIS